MKTDYLKTVKKFVPDSTYQVLHALLIVIRTTDEAPREVRTWTSVTHPDSKVVQVFTKKRVFKFTGLKQQEEKLYCKTCRASYYKPLNKPFKHRHKNASPFRLITSTVGTPRHNSNS